MSNYTRITDFTSKDSLPTGNPSKAVLGAEIEDELDAIAVAIATKNNSITKGTQAVQNPVTANIVTTQAHGLGAAPTYLICKLVCVTGEFGYSINDEIDISSDLANGTIAIVANATNTYIVCRSGIAASVQIINRSTLSATPITLANWKIVVTPVLLP